MTQTSGEEWVVTAAARPLSITKQLSGQPPPRRADLLRLSSDSVGVVPQSVVPIPTCPVRPTLSAGRRERPDARSPICAPGPRAYEGTTVVTRGGLPLLAVLVSVFGRHRSGPANSTR